MQTRGAKATNWGTDLSRCKTYDVHGIGMFALQDTGSVAIRIERTDGKLLALDLRPEDARALAVEIQRTAAEIKLTESEREQR